MTDRYIAGLLNKWGEHYFAERLLYPNPNPMFKEYIPRGYKTNYHDPFKTDIERIGIFMTENLSPMRYQTIKVRFRQGLRHKRMAAKFLRISEHRYREYYNDAINIIELRFV